MTTRTSLLASTAIAAAMLSAAPAEAGNFYVKMFGGANWVADTNFTAIDPTNTSDTMTWSIGGDTGWVVGGAVGYDLNEILRGWRTELEVSYRENQRDGGWTTNTFGGANHHSVVNITLLYTATRSSILDADLDNVTDTGVTALGTTKHLYTHN